MIIEPLYKNKDNLHTFPKSTCTVIESYVYIYEVKSLLAIYSMQEAVDFGGFVL